MLRVMQDMQLQKCHLPVQHLLQVILGHECSEFRIQMFQLYDVPAYSRSVSIALFTTRETCKPGAGTISKPHGILAQYIDSRTGI